MNATTVEMYLEMLEFREEELEQIVKASCNAERLMFNRCEFYCTTALDFGSAFKYKTKILSLQIWKYTSSSKRMPDIFSSPACFDKIVEAISKSGLRDSLQTINIYNNHSPSAEKLQKMLNKKGMPHITVEDKYLGIDQF